MFPAGQLQGWGLPPGMRDSLEPGGSRTEGLGFQDGYDSPGAVTAAMVGKVGRHGPEVACEWRGQD